MKKTTVSQLALGLCCAAIVSCVSLEPEHTHRKSRDRHDGPPPGSRYLIDNNSPPPVIIEDRDNVRILDGPPRTQIEIPDPDRTVVTRTTTTTVTPPPVDPPTVTRTTVTTTPPTTSQTPYGKPVPGKKGFVFSPFDEKAGMIDVRDYTPGQKVRDPYTNKIFLVP